jgi:hypothetical protein
MEFSVEHLAVLLKYSFQAGYSLHMGVFDPLACIGKIGYWKIFQSPIKTR